MGVTTVEPRNPQGIKQRDLLNQWQSESSSEDAVRIYMEAFPDESEMIRKFLDDFGADNAFRIIQESFIEPAETGIGDLRQAEASQVKQPERIPEETISPETPLPQTQQPTAETTKPLSPFAALTEQEDAEAAGRAQLGEAIVGEIAGFGEYLKKEYVVPYVEAKRTLVDKPLAKLEKIEREAIRKGIARMRQDMVYLPTIDETKELVEARNWMALRDLAEDGRLPAEEELGTEYIQNQIGTLAQEMTDTQAKAQIKIMSTLFNDPSSSWLRRGEIKHIDYEWIAKHPKLSILPLVLAAPAEEVARIATTPTMWDELVLYYSAGRLVLQPATKAGVKYLSSKGWATKPITPLKAVGRKFPKKQPVSVADIQAILKADPDVGDDILKAFTNLTNKEKANIARAVKMGKPVHLSTPRFKGGESIFGQPPVERLDFGVSVEQRPFYPPVPTPPGQPTAPPTTPMGEAVFGVQGNLPMMYEPSIAEAAAQVPITDMTITGTALPEQPMALTEGQDPYLPGEMAGMRRPPIEPPEFFPPVPVPSPSAIPLTQRAYMTPSLLRDVKPPRKPVGLLPPPSTPSPLLTMVSDPEAQTRTGLSSDMVNILRRKGMTDQQITELVGAANLLPEGVTPPVSPDTSMYELPVTPTEPPPAEAIPLAEEVAPEVPVEPLPAEQQEAWQMSGESFATRVRRGLGGAERYDLDGNLTEVGRIMESLPKMTGTEILEYGDKYGGNVEGIRRKVIEQAISEGKPVPPDVMADYPDLQSQTTPVEKPARVIPKRSKVKKGKIQVLPDKARLLSEIDTAIKKAPERNDLDTIRRAVVGQEGINLADLVTKTDMEEDKLKPLLRQLIGAKEILSDRQLYKPTGDLATPAAGGGKLTFKMDGGSVQINNNKEALTQVRKLVAKVPLTMDAPGVENIPAAARGGLSPNREEVLALVKGAPEGYFTDGRIIVKGTPPKSAKFDPADREILPETVLNMLKRPTDAADLQYYALASEGDIGVSSEPIVTFEKKQTPWAIFRTGNKFVAYNQYKVNVIKKRYPDAKYGIDTSTSMLIAYDDGEPVGAVMGMKVVGNEDAMMDTPPAYTMATEAGLIEELADATKDIAELHALGYDQGQVERLSGTDARELIADQIPAAEVSIGDDGNVTRQGGAKTPRPETGTTEELTAENVKEQEKIRKESMEGGFVGFRKRSPNPSPKPRKQLYDSAKRVTGNDEFAEVFYQSRDDLALWERVKRGIRRVGRETEDLVMGEANHYLWKAAKSGDYPAADSKQIAQFANKNRTHYQNTREKGLAVADRDDYGLWGELDAEQQEWLANLIYLRRIQDTLSRGLPETADITLEQAKKVFDDQFRATDSQVRDAFDRYDTFQRAFVYQHLVDRGKLNPEYVHEFYAPEHRTGYYWGGFLLPEPAKPRYRGYLKRQTGSKRGSHVSLEVIRDNWAVVHADNMYEDFMLEDLASMDSVSRDSIRTKLGNDQAEILFKSMKPHQTIPGEKGKGNYRVVQFEPGRVMFRGLLADPELLRTAMFDAAIDVDRLLGLPPDQQADMLDSYLRDVGPRGGDAIRSAIVMGRYKQLYVVPEPVSWRLRAMRDKPMHIPLLRQLTTMTSYWKGLVLGWSGLRYQIFQALFLDTPLQFLIAPGSLKKLPRALKMVAGLHKLLIDPASMGPEIQETYEIVRDEGVLDSGFLREYMMLKPDWKKLSTWFQTPGRWGAKREVLNRIAIADYQLHERVKKGLPIEAIHLQKKLEHLTPKQGIGLVARNLPDFEDMPGWYRTLFRGFLFPFITGAHKGAKVYAELFARMPLPKSKGGRPLRFLGAIVAPIAGVYLWNNTGWRKEIRDRLGWSGGKVYATILKAWDDDDDGHPNRVLIWSPRTSLDETGEWIGVDKLLHRLRRLRRKAETNTLRSHDIDDFMWQTMKDMGFGPLNKVDELKSPILQFWEGYNTNIDPFTKKQVMPPEVKDTPEEATYLAAYMVEKLISPLSDIAGGRGQAIPGGVPATWNKWSRGIAGAVFKGGPLDAFGALGFKVIDLDRVATSEIRAEKYALTKARSGYLRKLRDEFVSNPDIRIPESLVEFYNQALVEYDAVDRGEAPTSEMGRIFEDAKERGIDLSYELSKGVLESGSIKNIISHPRAWAMKLKHALDQGATRTLISGTPTPLEQPRHFTKDEKQELTLVMKALINIDLNADIADEPFGVREELIREVLGVYGVDVEELLEALEPR